MDPEGPSSEKLPEVLVLGRVLGGRAGQSDQGLQSQQQEKSNPSVLK